MAEALDIYEKEYEHYVVLARSTNNENIKKFTFLKKIVDFGEEGILHIKETSKKAYKIECKSKEVANKLILEQPFKSIDVDIRIPFQNKYQTVIINDVDIDITDNDLKVILGRVEKVHSIYRFSKTINTEDGPKQIPTKTVKISFEADFLPKYAEIIHMRCHMKPFIPKVKICGNCCNFGHLEKFCKRDKRCKECGEQCVQRCTKTRSCPSCQSPEHAFGDKSCLTLEKEELIQSIMVLKKLSYPEARAEFYGEKTDAEVPTFGGALYNKEFPEIKKRKVPEDKQKVLQQNRTSEIQSKMNQLSLKIQYNRHKFRNLKAKNSPQTRLQSNRVLLDKHVLSDNINNNVNKSNKDRTLAFQNNKIENFSFNETVNAVVDNINLNNNNLTRVQEETKTIDIDMDLEQNNSNDEIDKCSQELG